MQNQRTNTHGRARHGSTEGGFTLMEILAAITIIAIMAAVAIPRFADFRAVAYDSRSQQDLRNLAAAQELYRVANEHYAAQIDELTGFTSSDGVDIRIQSADLAAFSAAASHPGGRHRFAWNSAARPPLTKTETGG